MTHLSKIVTFRPKLLTGLGGNYYVISTDRNNLDALCVMIKKARNSVYFNEKYDCWAIRIKNDKQKEMLRKLFERINR